MSVITREELDTVKREIGNDATSLEVLYATLRAVSPEKLLTSYEETQILDYAKKHGRIDDFYMFSVREAAIELCMPVIWKLYLQQVKAEQEMREMAVFFLTPARVEDL